VNFSVITIVPPLGALVFNSTTVAELPPNPSTVDNKIGGVFVLVSEHRPLTTIVEVNALLSVFWKELGDSDILYSLIVTPGVPAYICKVQSLVVVLAISIIFVSENT
jgi:hypothetical protein